MRRVFADTYFYLALRNRRDPAHQRALEFVSERALEIITTSAVVLEVGDALSAPSRRFLCGDFLAELLSQPETVRHVGKPLLQRGLSLYRQRNDKGWSLTDCISFTVMADEGLTEALTGDHHFEQAGFRALLHDGR